MLDWLSNLIAPLNTVLFTMGGDAVTWAELLGFATGAACVALTVANRIENFPVGIANSAFFLVLFGSARLWADSGLQAVYIVLGFVGWWQWVRGRGSEPHALLRDAEEQRLLRSRRRGYNSGIRLLLGLASTAPQRRSRRAGALSSDLGGARHTALRTENATRNQLIGCAVWVVAGTVGLMFFLRWVNGAAPFWDALTTALSLAAQYLLNARRVQTWWFWIAADVIYVPLYFSRDLNLTGIVYILFLGLAITGFVQWRRTQQNDEEPERVTTTVAS